MTAKKRSARAGTTRFPNEALEFRVSLVKVAVHTLFWGAIMWGMAEIFIFSYPGRAAAPGDGAATSLVAAYGHEAVVALGVAVILLIGFYLGVLWRHVFMSGPLYKVSAAGISFPEAGGLAIPKNAIHSVFLTYTKGVMSGVVLEVTARERLAILKRELPLFSGVTVDPEGGSLAISLTGLRNKTMFVGALDYLTSRRHRPHH